RRGKRLPAVGFESRQSLLMKGGNIGQYSQPFDPTCANYLQLSGSDVRQHGNGVGEVHVNLSRQQVLDARSITPIGYMREFHLRGFLEALHTQQRIALGVGRAE